MHKLLIAIAGACFAACAATSTQAEPAQPRHIAKADLKKFCDKNNGQWTELGINGDNGYQCEIKGIGTWSCSAQENCAVSKTMVFNKPSTNANTKTNSAAGAAATSPSKTKAAATANAAATVNAAATGKTISTTSGTARGMAPAPTRTTPALGGGAFGGSVTPTTSGPAGTVRKLP